MGLGAPLRWLENQYLRRHLRGRGMEIEGPGQALYFRRSRTPLAQLVAEYENPESFDWRAHYVDWVKNVNAREPEGAELAQTIPALISGAINIHYQVWIDEDLFLGADCLFKGALLSKGSGRPPAPAFVGNWNSPS